MSLLWISNHFVSIFSFPLRNVGKILFNMIIRIAPSHHFIIFYKYSSSPADYGVYEDAELLPCVPFVQHHSSTFYTPPETNIKFPEIHTKLPEIRFCFASEVVQENVSQITWSVPVDVSILNDVFVQIPHVCDVKIHVEAVGHTRHMYVDPVSRAEVSAKEIRSRIKGNEKTVVVHKKTEKTSVSPEKEYHLHVSSVIDSSPLKIKQIKSTSKPTELETCIHSKQICFIVCDENVVSPKITEVLRVTACDILMYYSNLTSPEVSVKYCPFVNHNVNVCLGDFQIDNQLYERVGYDFPVLFTKQNGASSEGELLNTSEMLNNETLKDRVKTAKKRSLLTINISLIQDLIRQKINVDVVDFSIKPIAIFAEDKYIYDLLKVIDSFIPSDLSVSKRKQQNCLPCDVKAASLMLTNCVRIGDLSVEPFELLLSVHASLKLFISSEDTPLR